MADGKEKSKIIPIIHGWLLLVLILCVVPTGSAVQLGVSIPHLDKLVHALMYGVPAALLAYHRKINPAWIVYLAAYGVLIETIQFFLPYRSGDGYDIMANLSGIALGWCIGSAIKPQYRK